MYKYKCVYLQRAYNTNGLLTPKTTTTMTHTTSDINRNFKIKVFGFVEDDKKINTLVGVSGLIKLIGEDLADKFTSKAMRSSGDKLVCKLRRGIKVTFYVF